MIILKVVTLKVVAAAKNFPTCVPVSNSRRAFENGYLLLFVLTNLLLSAAAVLTMLLFADLQNARSHQNIL